MTAVKIDNLLRPRKLVGNPLPFWLRRAPQLKVAWSIVKPITIDVVYFLAREEWPTDYLCHDKTVLGNVTCVPGHWVASGEDVAVSRSLMHPWLPGRATPKSHVWSQWAAVMTVLLVMSSAEAECKMLLAAIWNGAKFHSFDCSTCI